MAPDWLTIVAWISLSIAALCAAGILVDTFVAGHRQPMWIMEAVWPVTALYAGPVAVWAYARYGRPMTAKWQRRRQLSEPPEKPKWASTAVGVSHCGAGCTLGDIIAAFIVFALGLQVAGSALVPELIGDYALALLLGILFQYFAIAPMRKLGVRDGLTAAAKADFLSLTAFEIGLFAWMILVSTVLFTAPHLHPDEAAYWLMMQIGMVLGFITAWPANVWLMRRGIKEVM
ncbi:DUF4396 domain-containing protein [Gordonia sp. GONU]|uniref:DUF4396 domain-containing protein n=1 Tax=Gordonia sp. GONU TaxID=2972949 RepID=UPI0021ABE554|nr:DUF4396 domain-containing protein [Gordonia sp. GONU]MCR8897490.1 DUF4396 domain-containing protein [Gordonia sp. GONU]